MTMMTIMTYPLSADRNWSVAEAKAKFSEVIERARNDSPQMITRKGKPAVIVVSAEEWERKTKRHGTILDFLACSPLKGVELDLGQREQEGRPRPIDL
jgi:prevent-host-death family protein